MSGVSSSLKNPAAGVLKIITIESYAAAANIEHVYPIPATVRQKAHESLYSYAYVSAPL